MTESATRPEIVGMLCAFFLSGALIGGAMGYTAGKSDQVSDAVVEELTDRFQEDQNRFANTWIERNGYFEKRDHSADVDWVLGSEAQE